MRHGRNTGLQKDTRDWKVHLAQADLRNHPDVEQHIQPINYRPFDTRWTYYTAQSRGFHCMPSSCDYVASAYERKPCPLYTIAVIRSATTWQHVFSCQQIIDGNCISNTKMAPPMCFRSTCIRIQRNWGFRQSVRSISNLLFSLRSRRRWDFQQIEPFNLPEGVSPEEILAYIYAVLYSPTYRERYYEFLKYDFPRIPLPRDIEQFRSLAALGQRLIDSHLLKNVSRPEVAPTGRGAPALHRFEGEGDGVVSRVRYLDGQIWINSTQCFTDVPVEVWEYEVGSYQVCEKWLRRIGGVRC